MPIIGPESRYFAGRCFCETPSTWGIGEGTEAAWECPDCGDVYQVEDFRAEDGTYRGSSWIELEG